MRLFVFLTFGLLLSAQSTEYFHVMGGFYKGSEYLELNAQQRAAYAAGFVNGMSVAALVLNGGNDPKDPKWLAACVSEMTTTQIAEIMRKDIQEKPAQWHLGMNTLGFNAVAGACGQYYSSPKLRRSSGLLPASQDRGH
jgi:hypothetical protein